MSARQNRTLVIRNGTLVDGTGAAPAPNESIVIEGNRIAHVGPLPEAIRVADRDAVEVVDATGRWILPGLIDAHTHISYGAPKLKGEARGRGTVRPELNALRAAWNAQKVLRAGVTGISVPGGSWFTDVGVRDAIKLGLIEGPRMTCAARMIATYGSIEDEDPSWVGTPDHSLGVLCNTVDEMVTEVRRQCKHGVDFIKMADSRTGETQCISRAEMEAVVGEAHRRNARVAIHSRGPGSTRDAALAGVDWIIHGDLATEEDLEAVAKAGTRLMPTATFVERVLQIGREVGQDNVQIDISRMERQKEALSFVLRTARAMDITVMCGTDSGNYDWMPYGELHATEAQILVEWGGYTELEAIGCFTRNNAFALGLDGELGTVERGMLADVILLDADPVADIGVLARGDHLSLMIKDGRIVDFGEEGLAADRLTFREAATERSRVA